MRRNRLFVNARLEPGELIELPERRAHYVARVLRLHPGDRIDVFDGKGHEHRAEVAEGDGRQVTLKVGAAIVSAAEPGLHITLTQAISRGERMDLTLQKATELGVSEIQPVFSERTEVRLKEDRVEKKLGHWRGVMVSACEQSGRTTIPRLHPPTDLQRVLAADRDGLNLLLSPTTARRLREIDPPDRSLRLAVGPEGGFTEDEEQAFMRHGWQAVCLGPRILRTETAGAAAIAAIQALWGDF